MSNEMTRSKFIKVNDIIRQSWDATWENIGKLLPIILLALLIYIVVAAFSAIFGGGDSTMGNALFHILTSVTSMILYMGIINICLKIIDKQSIKVADLFSKWHLFLNYLFYTIIAWIVVTLGLICLIIPGIFLIVRFAFGYIVLIDKEIGPIESLKQSWEIVKGCSWEVLLLIFICFLINLAGLLLLGIGMLFTFPMTTIAFCIAYRQLDKQTVQVIVP